MKNFIAHIINSFKTSKAFSIIVACSITLVVIVSIGAAVLISEEKQQTDASSSSMIETSSDTTTETVAETTESVTETATEKPTETKKAETTTQDVVTTASDSTIVGEITLTPEQLEAFKYCGDCGRETGYGDNGTCAKFTYDMNCPKCGEFCMAHTCHTCNG